MAAQTSDKRAKGKPPNGNKPFDGTEGKTFTSETQPTPEAKSEGWKKLRAERLLTQAILAHMTKGKNMETYISSLYTNAKKGNAKAIESINKGVEDDILKIDSRLVDAEGNDRNFDITLKIS